MTAPWTGLAPLPHEGVQLLEASAGTGKTWQIEALVVRLIAEEDLAIERILVMTFTEAATAELRGRVRLRLAAARDSLASGAGEPSDPVVRLLWADESRRGERRDRITRALASFDLAAISTLHGFAQRMLTQLAFESGQEPGLELLAEWSPILEELVADELARTTADATDAELAALEELGWDRDALLEIGRAMCAAVEPEPSPLASAASPGGDALAIARERQAAVRELELWLASAEGQRSVEALVAESARPTPKQAQATGSRDAGPAPRRFAGQYLAKTKGQSAIDALRSWLAQGAPTSGRRSSRSPHVSVTLSWETLERSWSAGVAELERFEAAPLFRRVSALTLTLERLVARARAGFAGAIRSRLHAELARRGLLTYDTLLSSLAERIAAEGPSGRLASAIRDRYEVALVDEFQDTDAAQWAVLEAAFACPGRRLFLVGDPKQAIYGFRGADLHVYLRASRTATARGTMTNNRRSDATYIAALNHVFGADRGVFELPGVEYVPVTAHHRRARVTELPPVGDRPRRALELRWLAAEPGPASAPLTKGAAAALARRSCVAEVVSLLGSELKLEEEDPASGEVCLRRVHAGDLAILVRSNQQGRDLERELGRAGVRAVRAADTSVFGSAAAAALATFLDALAAPRHEGPARALAVGPLFDWSAQRLAGALGAEGGDATGVWDRWRSSVDGWAAEYHRRGFLAALEAALDSEAVLPRVLQSAGGERFATDLRHLAELGHAEERRARLGPAALAAWLRARATDEETTASDEVGQRLESDARAVQLVTVHKSKGLEYPIVLLPFGWDSVASRLPESAVRFHPAASPGSGRPALDLHAAGTPEREAAIGRLVEEQGQEELRLLYVALTRARHLAVAWVGEVKLGTLESPEASALGRVLARHAGGEVARSPWRLELGHVTELAARSAETVGVSQVIDLLRPTLAPRAVEPVHPLSSRPWSRAVAFDTSYRVTSFSALVGALTGDQDEPLRDHDLTAEPARGERASDPEELDDTGDEATSLELLEPSSEPPRDAAPLPLAPLRGGKQVGTWVHAVLEQLDFAAAPAPDLTGTVAAIAAAAARHGVAERRAAEVLVGALPAILETPLDGGTSGVPAGFRLRSLERRDRLDELAFDLRLGAGRRFRPEDPAHGGRVHTDSLVGALAARAEREPGWFGAAWARRLAALHAQGRALPRELTGILTGSIDLVFRVRAGRGGARYYVADYKTNRIAGRDAPGESRAGHYARPWLAWEMSRHGYHLQALLYSVALHRLLALRLGPSYDYDRHVGGYFYLFLRGMTGAAAARSEGLALGVLQDRWPRETIVAVDRALGTPARSPEGVP